jgi:hypothetical protein
MAVLRFPEIADTTRGGECRSTGVACWKRRDWFASQLDLDPAKLVFGNPCRFSPFGYRSSELFGGFAGRTNYR